MVRSVRNLLEKGFAEQMHLQPGDPFRFEVTLPAPATVRGQRVYGQIVGTLDSFPTLGDSPNPFLVAPLEPLLLAINAGSQGWPLEPNEVWLRTNLDPTESPLRELLSDPSAGVTSVHTATG